MNWQYKTILFEFQKDGLLGDRYIDDDEVQKVLNEQGRKGWELVNVTPVQEGLLSFFKRALSQAGKQGVMQSSDSARPATRSVASPARPVQKHPLPKESKTITSVNRQAEKPSRLPAKSDVVGEIKIS